MQEYLNQFQVGQFNFNYEAIIILVNTENKIGFSSIAKLRKDFPITIQEYLANKLEVGNIKVVEEEQHKIIFLPYKEKYSDKFNINFYINIIKGLKQIEKYIMDNNIKSLFFFDFEIEDMNWNYLSSMLIWYLIKLNNTNIYTEKVIKRLERDDEAKLLNCLESSIS